MAVVALSSGGVWSHTYDGPAALGFACVSPRSVIVLGVVSVDPVTLEVRFNAELVDRLTTAVPHSWWKWAGNPLFPGGIAAKGDVLEVRSISGAFDLRLDYE